MTTSSILAAYLAVGVIVALAYWSIAVQLRLQHSTNMYRPWRYTVALVLLVSLLGVLWPVWALDIIGRKMWGSR